MSPFIRLLRWCAVLIVLASGPAAAGFFDDLEKALKKATQEIGSALEPMPENDAQPGSRNSRGNPGEAAAPIPNLGAPQDFQELMALDQDIRLGPIGKYWLGFESFSNSLRRYRKALRHDDPRTLYAQNVLMVLAMASRSPYFYGGLRAIVADDAEENAFAAPGGFILITTGMLKSVQNEDELASVLSHEMAHMELNHSVYESTMRKTAAYMDENAERNNGVKSQAYSQMVSDTLVNGYSARIESEADKRAAEILQEAGYNPYALLRVLEREAGETAGIIGGREGETYYGATETHISQGAADTTYAGYKYPKKRADLLLDHLSRIMKVSDTGDLPERSARFNSILGP